MRKKILRNTAIALVVMVTVGTAAVWADILPIPISGLSPYPDGGDPNDPLPSPHVMTRPRVAWSTATASPSPILPSIR
jgi:hypothetical protein